MAEKEGKAPVIIKRIKKGGHAAHGGAWKVAYADFVTAMMAFFLLLWLLNSVTEEQLQGISNYFAPNAASTSSSGAGGMLGGQTIGEGAQQSNTSSPAITPAFPPSTIGSGGMSFTDPKEGLADQNFEGLSDKKSDPGTKEKEKQEVDKISSQLGQAIQDMPELKALQNSLVVDQTPEGLRIQIVDQEGMPMFPAGSSAMYEYTRKLITLVAHVIAPLPQKIAISGHTDSGAILNSAGYGNWELSADRALAARRILSEGGVDDSRISRVSGKAGSDPLLPQSPDSPRNRRISIVLLRDGNNTPTTKPVMPLSPPPLPSIIK